MIVRVAGARAAVHHQASGFELGGQAHGLGGVVEAFTVGVPFAAGETAGPQQVGHGQS